MCYYSYAPRGARVKRFVRTAVISCLAHPLTVWGPKGNAGRPFAAGVRTANQGVGPSLVRRFSFPDASTGMRSSVRGTGRRGAGLMDAPKIHGAPETPSGLAAAATRWRLRRQNIYIGGKKGFAEPPREPLAHNSPKASASIRACRPYLTPRACNACRRRRAYAMRPSVDAPSPSSGWRYGPTARAPRGGASRPCTS